MDQQSDDHQALVSRVQELEAELAKRDADAVALQKWLSAMPQALLRPEAASSVSHYGHQICIRNLAWSGRNDYYRARDELGWTYEVFEMQPGKWLCSAQGLGSSSILGNDFGSLEEAQGSAFRHYFDRVRKIIPSLDGLSLDEILDRQDNTLVNRVSYGDKGELDEVFTHSSNEASSGISVVIAERDAAEDRANTLQHFIETLLVFQPSDQQLSGAALSFRHDLGLLSDDEQRKTMQVGKFWLQAWQHELRAMRQANLPSHPDDQAVDRFARVMQRKLALKRAHGRGGWRDPSQCSAEALSHMLREHVDKGDPIDVANFCMMLHQRGEHISKEETQ